MQYVHKSYITTNSKFFSVPTAFYFEKNFPFLNHEKKIRYKTLNKSTFFVLWIEILKIYVDFQAHPIYSETNSISLYVYGLEKAFSFACSFFMCSARLLLKQKTALQKKHSIFFSECWWMWLRRDLCETNFFSHKWQPNGFSVEFFRLHPLW